MLNQLKILSFVLLLALAIGACSRTTTATEYSETDVAKGTVVSLNGAKLAEEVFPLEYENSEKGWVAFFELTENPIDTFKSYIEHFEDKGFSPIKIRWESDILSSYIYGNPESNPIECFPAYIRDSEGEKTGKKSVYCKGYLSNDDYILKIHVTRGQSTFFYDDSFSSMTIQAISIEDFLKANSDEYLLNESSIAELSKNPGEPKYGKVSDSNLPDLPKKSKNDDDYEIDSDYLKATKYLPFASDCNHGGYTTIYDAKKGAAKDIESFYQKKTDRFNEGTGGDLEEAGSFYDETDDEYYEDNDGSPSGPKTRTFNKTQAASGSTAWNKITNIYFYRSNDVYFNHVVYESKDKILDLYEVCETYD